VELQKLMDYIAANKITFANLIEEMNNVHAHMDVAAKCYYPLPKEEFDLAWSTKQWPREIQYASDNCDSALEEDKERMMNDLYRERNQFEHDLDKYEAEVAAFKGYGEIANTDKIVQLAYDLQSNLLECRATAENFNMREKVFGQQMTEYIRLDSMDKNFENYLKLWSMCDKFKENTSLWLSGPLLELEYADVEKDVNDWFKTSYRLNKHFMEEAPGSAEVAMALRENTAEFRKNLPVIKSLASPALRERHWLKLTATLNEAMAKGKEGDDIPEKINLDPDDDLTLQMLLDLHVSEHLEVIQEECGIAEKEFQLEKNLNAMIQDWAVIAFECKPYKDGETYLVSGTDDIITLLDDQIVKVQTMRGSPYIKPIESQCKNWEKRLQYGQHLVDEWIQCQRTWMYLEPIFNSEDIMRQMPKEALRFATVDKMWKKTMAETFTEPTFMECCTRDKLLQNFQIANEKLDQIQKGLNDYLEVKRIAFPRFFFLSNDELLEILSQTKDPLMVQPHLGKCFEGMNKVVFQDDLKITHMKSGEGEVVPLSEVVDPESNKNKGNVEMWLNEVEAYHWESIQQLVKKGLQMYPTMKRTDFALSEEICAQVVLVVSQSFWTQEVEAAIADGTLAEYNKNYYGHLEDIVELVKGKLTKLNRKTLGALTVMDVHAYETVGTMILHGISHKDQFEWMSQLRYYYEKNEDPKTQKALPEKIVACIVNARINYGYEYLGNSMRLVITPLTDRCYRTMMGAVDLLYGGAPEGPAGTGKTETVKDLAKAVAIQCVVFNCSDGLDYLAMAKFFKGLAASGAWCCFDEFNRINIEVLSVIAQQIMTITEGKVKKLDKFHFEGSFIKLNPRANAFITMNPGYAGRAELPDNLKALFRPCAMMVPDYAMIAEIRLISFGYTHAKVNAQKLVRVLSLSSEQLSSQKHYDYGMRAVNSIIVACGNLRQQLGDDPKWSEEKIVLRSVNDVNLPKFTNEDLPLFSGITSDLFPGVELPKADYGDLVPTLEETCENGITVCPGQKIYLKPRPEYIRKCIQLYETVQVRHGLMVVGAAYSGKTCIFHTLAEAMTLCNERGNTDFMPVQIHSMNPKSIKQGQLYGNFDENTHEWSDGILAVIYRNCSKDESKVLQWVVFDGPVDAVWIENMNTVLDDNKKLCLMSGEIVKMTDRMRMMFEPEDLEEASPATVSRVGIVYTQPLNTVGWRVMVQVWVEKKLPENLQEHSDFIVELTEWLVPPLVFFALKECVIPTPVGEMEMVASLLRVFDSVLKQWNGQASDTAKVVESAFFFAAIWSIGAVINQQSRIGFNEYFLELTNAKDNESERFQRFLLKNPTYEARNRTAMLLPGTDGICFDYKFELKKCTWTHWMDLVSKYVIQKTAVFSSILVPTLDTERQDFVVMSLLQAGYNILATGDTGTGKSVSVKKMLLKDVDQEKYAPMFLNFSAQTSANQTQDIIDGKLDKRRKGVLGPPLGVTKVIFVDDLNMPAKEEYGAQPPIELLRQWMDHGGWYDRKINSFIQLVDIQFMAAMGPPGGGRTSITQRYVRHFNVINFVPFDHHGLAGVFQTVADWFLSKFSGQIKALGAPLVESSLKLYESISRNLLPTPAKSHYTFNLRDLSKVFQGICQVGIETIKNPPDMIRLWSHECLRVFHDRLIDNEDRDWFVKEVSTICEEEFKMNYERKVKGPNQILLYGNFSDPRAPKRVYQEVVDHEKLTPVMDEYQLDYNSMCTPMALVLFKNAVEHISRISRILGQPQGNALLVGVGGSGRKSLTKLATFMQDYKIFEIEITKTYGIVEWREDLKKILMIAGGDAEPSVFLFSDTQIVKEGFVEDINGILNTGEVPNLFNDEERAMLFEKVNPRAAADGINTGNLAEVYNYFVSACKENLHCVLAFSPIGDAFRTRLRMFPALVNCCTIDWFTEWPTEALRSVANKFLEDVELGEGQKTGVIETCVEMQNKVSAMSKDYLSKLRRYYYVTPTSYLELINTFKSLLASQRKEIAAQRDRYANGLAKLEDTREKVGVMQVQLEELQPALKVAKKETDELLETIKHQQIEAEQTKKIVAAEEKVCNAQAADAMELKETCETQLAKAIPALESAVKALKTISKNDIVEVRGMKTPPKAVVLVMEAICLMMSVKPMRVKDPNGGNKKVDDYWAAAKKDLLMDVGKFIPSLMTYDKDNITPEIVEKVTPFTQNPEFQPEIVKKGSVAAAGLCKWVHAMIVYDSVAKVVAPKKAQLREAESTLAVAKAALQEKQDMLKKIVDKLAELDEGLQKALKKKQDLQDNVDQCAARLVRADQLIGGLGGEQVRWTEMVGKLGDVYNNVTGDIVLASGVIAYLGVFTAGYRADALAGWSKLLLSKDINCTANFRLTDTLGEPVKIADWTINKLPNDAFSVDNGIMLFKSNRWPLMIDPQGQANKWVKNMESENSLVTIKQSQSSFARSVENCLAFGQPCLIENAPEAIDPLLENVLLKRVIGGAIKLGDATVEYNSGFRLYITTSLRNPHYPPETCVKVNLLNFMATQEGLEDQMLGIVVAKEQPEMEEKRQQLVIQDADNKRQLKDIEDNILHLLKTSEGEIVDDLVLIDTLQKAKVTSKDIEEKVKEAKKVSGLIEETRASYVPVAFRSSHLFFCIADLASVDPMYQYSMEWYIMLFLSAVDSAEAGANIAERLANLNEEFTYTLYKNVCRSLFEKDKLLFSFLLCMKIAQTERGLDPSTLRYFLQGNPSIDMSEPNPASGWITDKSWIDFLGTREVKGLEWVASHVIDNLKVWEDVYNSGDAEADVKELCSGKDDCSSFLQLVILRCIRPDAVVPAVMHYLKTEMGQKFIEPPPFDLQSCYNDSTCSTPLIFVLTPGADPMSELNKLADNMGFGKKLTKISLGQGQGPLAENAISEAVSTGTWVCLQNCHLSVSWMPTLERLCEEMTPEKVEESFRLWLTSEPSKAFPPYVLQNGVKMTNEPPKGLRANLNGSYVNLTNEQLEESCVENGHTRTFQKMLFGLCFFHATVIERLKFGPLGWNIRYVFSVPDLNITRDQLRIFCENLNGPDDVVPYAALAYLAGECNYGGRVTDDKDRRCLNNILTDFYTAEILDPEYKFSPSGKYYSPECGRQDDEDEVNAHTKALEYITNLPLNDPPEVRTQFHNSSSHFPSKPLTSVFSNFFTLSCSAFTTTPIFPVRLLIPTFCWIRLCLCSQELVVVQENRGKKL
jgi:dynein heavy chain